MSERKKSTEEKISDLRDEYVQSLSMRFAEMNNAYADILETTVQTDMLQNLEVLSHTLCGSAGTFGFGDIANYCKKIEELCKLLKSDSGNTNLMNEISKSFSQLEEAILSPKITDQTVLLEFTPGNGPQQIDKLIYLLDDDEHFSCDLKTKIEKYGYNVECFNLLDNFFNAIEKKLPEAIIVDILLENDSGTDALKFLYDHLTVHIPSVVISSSYDFESRLKTVKAGADAFLTKPFDTTDIIDTLEILIGDKHTEPYRVLIVDDVEAVASYYRIILERAGMICENISQPSVILEVLGEFDPDIVLMDLHMPECRGDEIAKMIHQEKTYISLPIVYLSSEINVKEQLTALQMAGDDFLTKPIRPSQLIGTIQTRAKRYRLVKSLMNNDSLTGLLNHSSLKAAIDKECSRASRHNQTFCFAMVDLDRFSDINNTYGHAVGDTVLKNLSWLFKERLRKTDVVGRYGGEEFGILMPDTDLESGKKILNEILKEFKNLDFRFDDKSFEVTFSAGLVTYPDYQNVDELCNAADRLLYDAKAAGRKQIVAHRKIVGGMIANA